MQRPPLFRLQCAVVAPLLLSVARAALGDVGAGAISITCDSSKDAVEVRLHILWNQDLDDFLEAHPTRATNSPVAPTTLLDAIGEKYEHSCKLQSRSIIATWEPGQFLTVLENGNSIARKRIDSVWFALDFEYRLRSDMPNRWEECINDDYGSFNGKLRCGPVTSSDTTGPTDIADKWE